MGVSRRPNSQQVARAGEHLVAAEIHRRGAYASTFAGNMPSIDLLACDTERERVVSIQVKTKRSGDWQTSIHKGRPREPEPVVTSFWVLVDLGRESPAFFVMPEWWIENNIHEQHQSYLSRHGGTRPRTSQSPHHRITTARVIEWQERWDLLGIFNEHPQ